MIGMQIFAAGITLLALMTVLTYLIMPTLWQPAFIMQNAIIAEMPNALNVSAVPGLGQQDFLGNQRLIPVGFTVVSFACIIAYAIDQKQEEEEEKRNVQFSEIPDFAG